MMDNLRPSWAFGFIAFLLITVGFLQSWNVALGIFNLCLICAVMSLGVNIQWGYGGLFNVGIMGFAALGGMAALLVSKPPIPSAWAVGGPSLLLCLIISIALIAILFLVSRFLRKGITKILVMTAIILGGVILLRTILDPAVLAIEADNPATSGYLGGLGLPIMFSWIIGAILAAGAAWLIGKVALGLRSDYLAIATLGIAEILITFIKNEDWLTRGVKNVSGLERPVPYELDLQTNPTFISAIEWLFGNSLDALDGIQRHDALTDYLIEYSSIFVKLCYSGLFLFVLLIVYSLCAGALNSSWGRMMRAIRDNEISAASVGKNIKERHLQLFILGSAVVGLGGAMLTTLDGQFTPGSYHPLRFTFLIWVMVIVGGSGNNAGAVLGGFLIWFVWVEAEPVGQFLISFGTSFMDESNYLRVHLRESAQYMRLIVMGIVLLSVMRLRPGGLLPERTGSRGSSS